MSTDTRSVEVRELRASARKLYGKYKAVILHPPSGGAIGDYRSEYLGTRYHVTQDGRDVRVTKGAPLYDAREEAVRVAQAVIDERARLLAERRAAYEGRHRAAVDKAEGRSNG